MFWSNLMLNQKNLRYKKVLECYSLQRVKISDGSDFAIKSYGRNRKNFQIWDKFENMSYMLFWGHVKNLLWGNFGKIKKNIFLHTYSRCEKFSKLGPGCWGHVMFHSCRFSQAMRYKAHAGLFTVSPKQNTGCHRVDDWLGRTTRWQPSAI